MSFILFAVRSITAEDQNFLRPDRGGVTFTDPVFSLREKAESYCDTLNTCHAAVKFKVSIITLQVDG